MDDMQLAVAPLKVAELAAKLECTPINQQPGAWVCDIDPHWRVAVNGQKGVLGIPSTDTHMGITELPSYHLAVWFNGWLAGMMSPFEGVIAYGEAANEDTFIAAIEAAIQMPSEVRWYYAGG